MHQSVRTGVAAALLVSTLVAAGGAEAKVVERIVAVVNKRILLLSQVNERVRPLVSQLQQIPDMTMRKQRLKQLRRQVLNHLIDEALIRQEASKLKLKVSDKDLELAIKDVMRKNKLTREQLEAALRQEGKSIAAYKQKILRPQLLRMRVVNVQVRSRVAVSKDEIKALYQKNLRALGVETKVRARHIFVVIPVGASGKKVMDRKRYAVSLAAKGRKKGADFAALAKKYSEDSVTRTDGGDLGYFSRGTLPANIEAVVFAMKKGDIRGPMRTERGYHVIKLVDRKESSARSLADVKEELRNQIYMKKVEKATKAWLKELRKRSYVDIKV
jgi:peptidyl-prolyl cis-trans isomerase SurA